MKRFLSILFILFSLVGIAQYDTLHLIPPVAFSYFNNQTELVFSTPSNQLVNVSVFKSDGTLLFNSTVIKNFPSSSIIENTLPLNETTSTNSLLANSGLIVKSNFPVSVNVRNIAKDLYLPNIKGNYSLTSMGQLGLGSSFHLIGYRNTSLFYGILAKENGTIVTINNAINQTINLNAGESYLISSQLNNNNIGTLVTSNKPICMSSSATVEVPDGCGDPIANQIIPDNIAGKEYIIIRGNGNITLEQFTIVATQSNTNVSINGVNTNFLNAGSFSTFSNGVNFLDYKYLVSDKPILVVQGSGYTCEADQSMIPPLTCTGSKLIQTKDFDGLPYDVYVITHPNSVPTLNGTSLTNPISLSSNWVMYTFNQNDVVGSDILLESSTNMHCGILQNGDGFSMFAYFSGFQKLNSISVKLINELGNNELLEGCKDVKLVFNREDANSEEIISISTSGNAISGIDYLPIKSKDTLQINQLSDTIIITSLQDNVQENLEIINIHLVIYDNCLGDFVSFDTSVLINNYESMVHSEQNELFTCSELNEEIVLFSKITMGKFPYSFNWSNQNVNDTLLVFSNSLIPQINNYSLVVTDDCKNSISIPFIIYNQCETKIPNVITPNGDGINDFFIIKNIDHYESISLTILNRWGALVYESKSYKNDFHGLDMKSNHLPDGVYYYIVEIHDKLVENSSSKRKIFIDFFTIVNN